MKLNHFVMILALGSLSLTGCVQPVNSGATASTQVTYQTPAELTKTNNLGADAIETLATEALQVPLSKVLYVDADRSGAAQNVTLQTFLNENYVDLGGRGAIRNRDFSPSYAKTSKWIGLLLCKTTEAQTALFPSGSSDVSRVYMTLVGRDPTSAEISTLTELSNQFSSETKKRAAICSAVFGSLAVQIL